MTPILDASDGPDSTPYDDSFNVENTRYDSSDLIGGETDAYPTKWHSFDVTEEMECRQLAPDKYEIRSAVSVMTLSQEGFNLFRDRSPQGQVIFMDWMERNNISSYSREGVESSEVQDVS